MFPPTCGQCPLILGHFELGSTCFADNDWDVRACFGQGSSIMKHGSSCAALYEEVNAIDKNEGAGHVKEK